MAEVKERKPTVGALVEGEMRRSAKLKKPMTYGAILAKVRGAFPDAKTTKASLDYYAWNLRKAGVQPNVDRSA